MNIYDTVNKLAQEIKSSEEYINYKMAKQAIDLNPELKEKITDFENARYDAQVTAIQTGKDDEEKVKKVQELYAELIQIDEAKKYFDTELKFNVILADINKIISEAVADVM
jgi:cell fate (sporulation/competence/biofilm development) regulator YlbF (YheA/YmcA/DUF963 family)